MGRRAAHLLLQAVRLASELELERLHRVLQPLGLQLPLLRLLGVLLALADHFHVELGGGEAWRERREAGNLQTANLVVFAHEARVLAPEREQLVAGQHIFLLQVVHALGALLVALRGQDEVGQQALRQHRGL